MSLKEIVEKV